jgi:DNA-binding GntR family transcriptional regulator
MPRAGHFLMLFYSLGKGFLSKARQKRFAFNEKSFLPYHPIPQPSHAPDVSLLTTDISLLHFAWRLTIMKNGCSIETLREKVYGHLKGMIKANRLSPGEFIDLNLIGSELGMSRTPLRDALFHLENEGFITIYPRRGVMLNPLGLRTIKNIFEIVGALEGAALLSVADSFSDIDAGRMAELDKKMKACLDSGDLDTHYKHNVAFHDVFLDKSENEELVRAARVQRERLYDFPERRALLLDWERSNLEEHFEIVRLLEKSDFKGASDFLRDVHWSYSVQEKFIKRFYFARKDA